MEALRIVQKMVWGPWLLGLFLADRLPSDQKIPVCDESDDRKNAPQKRCI